MILMIGEQRREDMSLTIRTHPLRDIIVVDQFTYNYMSRGLSDHSVRYSDSIDIALMVYENLLDIIFPSSILLFYLSFYCIIFHSPASMSLQYKTYLFLQSFFSALSSFTISAGTRPYFYTECLAGYASGFLNRFNVPTLNQATLNIGIVTCMSGASIRLFYLRYKALQAFPSVSVRSKVIRVVGFACWILFYFIFSIAYIFIIKIQNNESLKKQCLKNYKGEVPDKVSEWTIVVSPSESGSNFLIYLFLLSFVTLTYIGLIFVFGYLTRRRFLNLKPSMSKQALQKHIFLLRTLYTQTFAQLVLLGLPMSIIISFGIMNYSIPEVANYCVICVLLTNSACSYFVFISVKSYRLSIFRIFKKTSIIIKKSQITTLI